MGRPFIALAGFCTLLVACATTGSRSVSSGTQTFTASNTDQSQLTGDEIAAANLPTAYDLVERLRRPWLRRDPMTGGEVAVMRDNVNLGGADKLRDIPAVQVAAMLFLSNADAIRRFGSDVKGSVIVITPRR